ncbi:MAG: tRNA pseudouridine(13) synthase TruD [Anaerolineae bacterium]
MEFTLEWPLITPDLPGIGGQIKTEPSHFIVEEIPLYEPAGEGEHVYVCLRREGWTTRDLQVRLASLFGLKNHSVGYAGLKDKYARATQVFSLHLQHGSEAEVVQKIREHLPVEVLWARRHRNKLRLGHLLGNRFRILLVDPNPGALDVAMKVRDALMERGVPNYFGRQRFGIDGHNVRRGRDVLLGQGPRQPWLKRLLLSAFQSFLFNEWLAERIRRQWFDRILPGDIAKKVDTGGLFLVTDAEEAMERLQRRMITYTGPIYGYRLWWAEGAPGELEQEILQRAEVPTEAFRRAKLEGARRPARLWLRDLDIAPSEEGLWFSFTLPKGSYATVVLQEFMKAPIMLEESEDPTDEKGVA